MGKKQSRQKQNENGDINVAIIGYNGLLLELKIAPTNSIKNLKKKIRKIEGISTQTFDLMYPRPYTPTEDHRPLTSYKIKNGALIYLNPKVHPKVKPRDMPPSLVNLQPFIGG